MTGQRGRPRSARRWLGAAAAVAVGAAVTVVASELVVHQGGTGGEYPADTVPPAEFALVPGAQVYHSGQPSRYLSARLDLGRQLFTTGKVKTLLLTGNGDAEANNEPEAMRRYLTERGVPREAMVLDGKGYDTYRSCLRAYQLFGVRRAIVATQDFSMVRTVALCRAVGIETTAVADRGRHHDLTYRKCQLRERFAAVKAAWTILVRGRA